MKKFDLRKYISENKIETGMYKSSLNESRKLIIEGTDTSSFSNMIDDLIQSGGSSIVDIKIHKKPRIVGGKLEGGIVEYTIKK